MQWDRRAHAGFTKGTPWLPVAGDYAARNVEVERADPHSMLNLYRRLIALRRAEPAVAVGGYTTVRGRGDIIAYSRRDAGQRILIVLNLSARPQSCDLPGISGGRVLLSTQLDRVDDIVSDQIAVGSNEGLIIALAGTGDSEIQRTNRLLKNGL
jgi:alpha-glucosidase